MPRMRFEKMGNAIWISHLDLMRVFQRAFQRAGLPLSHTHGFNPRPYVSIVLPLSVGVESECELMDFDLDEAGFSHQEIRDRLNENLIAGVRVLEVYEEGRKVKHLAYLACRLTLEYDAGVPAGWEEAFRELFGREELLVEKKGKNGPTQQNIIPMIRRLASRQVDDHVVEMDAVVCCQNPALNPMQLVAAIRKELPQYAPDFAKSRRLELYEQDERIFR